MDVNIELALLSIMRPSHLAQAELYANTGL